MADTKISALSAASTPLGGTEVLPIVQSSSTVNVSIANLTAGRNISYNNALPGYTSTATAAGTTTLTASSTYHQRFSGSTTQTVVLPAATAMAKGQGFIIDNDSSGNLTLQDGSAGALGLVVPGMAAFVFCEDNSTTAGNWSGYMFVPGGGPSGQVTWGTAGLAMGGQTLNSANTFGFKNRIINGGMVIDQRNAGATVSAVANNVYLLDRMKFTGSATVSGKFNFAQNLNTITPPVGFTNYSGFQTATAYTVSGGDLAVYEQTIEGYNISDLAFGTASAKAFTISFWVYSSLTGTFGGCLKNAGYSYSYPFSYSIPTANTWTYITINVTAPTSSSWNSTNGAGLRVMFGLGAGATASGTANNTWQSADYYSATGAVSVVGTASATWYMTGFQVEVGTQATSFDFRDYGRELLLCQRYYWITYGTSGQGYPNIGAGGNLSTSLFDAFIPYPCQMRATPTYAQANLQLNMVTYPSITSINQNYGNQFSGRVQFNISTSVAGYGGTISPSNTTASCYFSASAEL